jgi:hypothetical protein
MGDERALSFRPKLSCAILAGMLCIELQSEIAIYVSLTWTPCPGRMVRCRRNLCWIVLAYAENKEGPSFGHSTSIY